MNKIKKIGITLRVEHVGKYNEKRDAISHDWVKFLEISNVFPIFIPNIERHKTFSQNNEFRWNNSFWWRQ